MDWLLAFVAVSGVTGILLAGLITFAIDSYFARKAQFIDQLAKGMRREDG